MTKLSNHVDALRQIAPSPTVSRRWLLWLKALVTVVIFVILFWRVDLSGFARAVGDALGGWLLLAFLSASLMLFTSTYKWDRLLRALGVFASWRLLLELYTIGFFVSSFLPGMVGGDVVRWSLTGQRTGDRLRVAATILAERVVGLVALIVLNILAIAVFVPSSAQGPLLVLLVGVSLLLVLALVLVLNGSLVTRLTGKLRWGRAQGLVTRVYELHRTLRMFPRKPLAIALGYSFLFYLSAGLTLFLICKAFGAGVTFPEAAWVQVVVNLIVLVPVSLGGLGLAQAGDVYFLGLLGVETSRALEIAIVRLVINYSYALIGGLLFIRWRSDRRALGILAMESTREKQRL